MPENMQVSPIVDISQIIDFDKIANGVVSTTPFPSLVAHDVISRDVASLFRRDFPDIKRPGFLPLDSMARRGAAPSTD